MKLVHFDKTRNLFGWKEGVYSLRLEFRGTNRELMQKLKEEIEKDLKNTELPYDA